MPISQTDIDRIVAALVARLHVDTAPASDPEPAAVAEVTEAVASCLEESRQPPKKNAYMFFLTCLVGDMAGARGMISQDIADKISAEADPKRTVSFANKPVADLDAKAWRALGVFAWKHLSPELRAKVAENQSSKTAFEMATD